MAGPGKKHTLRFDPRTELLLLVLANIVAFVFMIMGIVNASEGKRKPLPIIGDITLIK